MSSNISIYEILQLLEGTTSSNRKKEILKENDSPLLRTVLVAALDPMLNYYIRKIPNYKSYLSILDQESLESAIARLDLLSSRVLTGNAGVDHLQKILSCVSPEDAEVIKRIIRRDLRCGVGVTLVNSVFPDLIFEYDVMLCEQRKKVKNLTYPRIVDKKEDGMRINIILNPVDCSVDIKTRNGKDVDFFDVFDHDFKQICLNLRPSLGTIVLDGELLFFKDDGTTPLPRKTGNGLALKAQKGTITKSEVACAKVSLYDIIPLSGFVAGSYQEPLFDRRKKLESVVLGCNKMFVVPYSICSNEEEVLAEFNRHLELGCEGIVSKTLLSPWEKKRSKHFVKYKNELTADLRVIGVVAGTGKYEGMIGALECTTEDGHLEVNVGSGFTDADRDPSIKYLDKIIEVGYNEKITNRSGRTSLFLPIFKCIRLDKNKANTLSELE